MWRLLTSYILLCIVYNSSQAAYFEHYNTANKLPGNDVYSVFCDSKGFLWFSTSKGICKYDGESFRSFTVLDGIGSNEIFSSFEDSRHKLWLSTFNGSICYIRNDSVFNAANDSICRQIESFFDNTLSVHGVSYHNNICNIGDTILYVGHTAEAVVKFDKHGAKVLFSIPASDHLHLIKKVKEQIYIYTSKRTIVFDKNDRIVFSEPCSTRRVYSSNEKVVVCDSLGMHVYAHDSLIYTTDAQKFTSKKVSYVYVDTAGRIFCATLTGLYLIYPGSGRTDKLFDNEKITYVTQDIVGNYWITTMGDGVYFMHKELVQLTLLNNRNPKVTYCNGNQLFIQEGDSVFLFSEDDACFKRTGLQMNPQYVPLYADTDFIFSVYRDSFYIFDRHKLKTKRFPGPLKSVVHTDKGKYLFHYSLVIAQCNLNAANAVFSDTVVPGTGRIIKILYDTLHKDVYCLLKSSLYTHNVLSGKTSVVQTFARPYQPVDMYPVAGGLLLFTSNQHYAIYKDGKLSDFMPIKEDLAVYGIYDMMSDVYMVQTNKGYFVWNNKRSSFLKRMQFIEYPFNSGCLNGLYRVGKYMIASVDGKLYSFDKTILNREMGTPHQFIDKIYIDDKIYSEENIVLKNITQCNILIVIGGLYFNTADNYYQYRIVRNDEKGPWLNNDGRILNINLNTYGKYRIDIRATTSNGVKSDISSVLVVLQPPFYNTVTFYWLLAIAGIICLLYGIHLYHAGRRKKLQNELNHIQLEYKAVNSLMNPHFIFNAISNIQHLINSNSGDAANEYLVKLSRLIRQNIENLQFNLIPLDKELELIHNYVYLQNLRYGNNILYEVHNNIGSIDSISIPPLLLHTIIENSILHGYRNDGSVLHIILDISVTMGDYILMIVTDNGTGYHPKPDTDGSKSSLGLNATRKRLERLSVFFNVQYSLHIYNRREQEGTEVVIKMYSKFSELPAS